MKANLKVPNAKPKWWVYFPIFGGGAGEVFTDEWKAYRFAANNRPSRVVLTADELPSCTVAEFPAEPTWWSGYK